MAESIPVEGELTRKGKPRKVGHLKMFVIHDLKASSIDPKVAKYVDSRSLKVI